MACRHFSALGWDCVFVVLETVLQGVSCIIRAVVMLRMYSQDTSAHQHRVDVFPYEVEFMYLRRTKPQGHPLWPAADAVVCPSPRTSDSVKFVVLAQSEPR